MRRFILPTALASIMGLAWLPSQAHASWLSEAVHQVRRDYPAYDYPLDYGYISPYYSDYYTPSYIYPSPYYNSYYYAPGPLYYGGYHWHGGHHYGRYGHYGHRGHEGRHH